MTDEVDLAELGPHDYLIVEWPLGTGGGEALPLLLDLVQRGMIRILDLAFVRTDESGAVEGLPLTDLPIGNSLDASVFDGASRGILTDDDFADAAPGLKPGTVVGILFYENTWAVPFGVAVRQGGVQLVASGRIPIQAVLAALEATEQPPDPPVPNLEVPVPGLLCGVARTAVVAGTATAVSDNVSRRQRQRWVERPPVRLRRSRTMHPPSSRLPHPNTPLNRTCQRQHPPCPWTTGSRS